MPDRQLARTVALIVIALTVLLILPLSSWNMPLAAQDYLTQTPGATVTPTPGPTATPGPTGLGCDNPLPLHQGEVVYIRPGVIIRHQPSRSGVPVNYFTESTVAVISGGPVCADNYIWWGIRAPGNDGWVAEGTEQAGYFIESSGYLTNGQAVINTCNEPLAINPGEQVLVAGDVRVRQDPTLDGRVMTIVPHDTYVTVTGAHQCVDGINWWPVSAVVVNVTYNGWMTEEFMLTTSYLATRDCAAPLSLAPGQRAYVYYRDETPKALRSAPGRSGPLMYTLVANVPLEIVDGPVCVDGLNWWQVRVLSSNPVVGWMAEGGPGNYFIRTIHVDDRYR